MADQATVFSESDQTPPPKQSTTSNSDTVAESVQLLVGADRKYKTVEELAKAYMQADEFLEKLKGENAKLREEVAKGATLEQVLERLKDGSTASTSDQGEQKADVGVSLTASDVAKIVREQVSGMETQRSKEANLLKADALMKAAFGEKARDVFQKEAATPEMKKALMDLASVSPEKFLAVFQQPQGGVRTQVDGSTSVNTSALDVSGNSGRALDPGTKEFYDALRRKEPSKYYSHAIQLQMNKAAQADPNKFFNRK